MTAELFWTIFPLWIRAFALTLAVEVPLFVLIGRLWTQGDERVSIKRLALAGAAGTCVTHPLLWFAWPLVISDYDTYILTGELIVATVESFTFFALARRVRLSRAVAASFLANAASYGGGLALRALGLME